ncbi:DNA polymerase-3 subunit gamma/tau [Clostridium amylolyticum]|uniref:DNA-directed DNA polymerase n=1 Tax=Clostridium amylolyticum TaxID=1121298 RepID=A0A1M6NWZ1_9CLOT|nr:DNA polymerase III subunit gamma/tau [Clostridium amylolyticum]SHK00151.1 DNA polymerase-3 subunit gamma/tau [Clostridium amylolyticum]
MAYTALYREWRPKNFQDVVGQEHITITLKNQIKNQRTAHAYLFCGTRGTGKTSTAKIMAKALNCLNLQEGEPCNECEMCKKINEGLAIDVTELDAASNNGVDKIRDIIDDVQYPPQEARNKVYIMDEVHMLSQGAVNAFLKTLEEPPKNVVFILATTDPQKLPITILSRCQRFDFKRISTENISARLRKIVHDQGVFADDNSLNLIARIADGAMRDSLSILDQAISMGGGKVEYSNVINMLGLVTNENLFKLTDAVIERNVEEAMNVIDEMVMAGKDLYLFIKDMIAHYRNLLMVKVSNSPESIVDMSLENIELLRQQGNRIRVEEIMRNIRILQDCEEQSRSSKQARLYLELSVIKLCKIEYDTSPEVMLTRINKLEDLIKSGKIAVSSQGDVEKQKKNIVNKQATSSKKKESLRESGDIVNADSKVNIDMVKRAWKDILESFKARRNMLIYASLMTGKPLSCDKGVIIVQYEEQFSFNKLRLEKEDNRKIVDEVFSEILKDKLKVRYIVDRKEQDSKSTEDLIIEAFGEDNIQIIDE